MRPRTLAEVAQLTARGESFDHSLANFLDGFYAQPTESALSAEPGLLATIGGALGGIQDAYLAATAEQLACERQFPIPDWVDADARKLRQPWFASSLASLRALLILESPASFRSRNLFVSENALTRA